jgi:hypothetical protein
MDALRGNAPKSDGTTACSRDGIELSSRAKWKRAGRRRCEDVREVNEVLANEAGTGHK